MRTRWLFDNVVERMRNVYGELIPKRSAALTEPVAEPRLAGMSRGQSNAVTPRVA